MSIDSYRHHARAPQPGAPVVFAFHGTGGDEHQFSGLIGGILPDAGIVAPRGDVSEHGANRYFRRLAEGVYDMEDLAQRTAAMADFVRSWRERQGGHAFLGLGYSNGANMLASVMMEEPGLFSRAVLMHPLVPWRPERAPGLDGMEIMITGGRRDPICPLSATLALRDYLASCGAQVTVALHDGGHEVRQAEIDALAGFLVLNPVGKPA